MTLTDTQIASMTKEQLAEMLLSATRQLDQVACPLQWSLNDSTGTIRMSLDNRVVFSRNGEDLQKVRDNWERALPQLDACIAEAPSKQEVKERRDAKRATSAPQFAAPRY